jgi:hypothetical protein
LIILAGALLLAAALGSCSLGAQPAALPPTAPQPTAVPLTPSPEPVPALAPPAPRQAAERGATVPWVEYEAEDGETNGTTLETSRTFGQFAAESSGRRAVQLDATGQYVQFRATENANAIVVRYIIPDAAEGGGIDATISLYIDGAFRQKLQLTSKYAWSYGGEDRALNDPSAKEPHHFYDEARALVGDIPAGAVAKLQRDGDDSAKYYVIDLIDLEYVAPPAAMPDGFLSVAECGATPDDGKDDGPAIQACMAQAMVAGKGLWLPPGTFESSSKPKSDLGMPFANLTIRGAGMWHTIVRGPYARFHCTGDSCQLYDFAILGETTQRDDNSPENGVNGGGGKGSRLENIWIEHTKVGWWVGAGNQNVTDGLVISGSRFRNLFADGVNFCNGTSNSVVENSHFRNTGDDALASWAPSFDGGVNTNNVFRFNTVQVPWRANCFAIYGGKDNRIEDNLCYDVVTYPGILISNDFRAHPFSGTTSILRNSLIRAGGPMWLREHGALKIQTITGPIAGLLVQDLVIDSPTFAGIEIQGPNRLTKASFENITISSPGTAGILIQTPGAATFSAVTVVAPGGDALSNKPLAGKFEITKGQGNEGW